MVIFTGGTGSKVRVISNLITTVQHFNCTTQEMTSSAMSLQEVKVVAFLSTMTGAPLVKTTSTLKKEASVD